METLSLAVHPTPSRVQLSHSPEPETTSGPSKKKKRSREEKERRRFDKEAKRARKGLADTNDGNQVSPQNGSVENGEQRAARDEDSRKIKKKSKKHIHQSLAKPPVTNGDTANDDAAQNEEPVEAATDKHTTEKKKSKEEKARRKAEKKAEKDNIKAELKGSQPLIETNPSSKSSKKRQVSSKVSIPPSLPPTRPKKRERSTDTPLVSVSQAGPSTPKKRSMLTAKPVRQPSSTPKSKPSPSPAKSRAGSSKGDKENKVDDATLKARLSDQNAIHEYLANTWVSEKELGRLERLGILTYKKGRFTESEKVAVRKVLDNYKKVHRLDDDELIDRVMSTTLTFPAGREEWRSFWLDLAAVVSGRPGKYVQRIVQRMYDPNGHKGHFTPEEDDMLIKAYELYPNDWSKIAEIVERTYHDCRDRYTKELQHRHTRLTGLWTPEEEVKLLECVKKMNRSLGHDELESEGIPWELVVKEMGGTRTVVQCRKKWTDQVLPSKAWGWEKGHARENDWKLIKRLEALDYPTEKHINWKEVQDESLSHMTSHQVRQMYYRMKDKVSDAGSMSFQDLVKEFHKVFSEFKTVYRPKHPSRNQIDSSDEEHEIDDAEKNADQSDNEDDEKEEE
ncbi:uncharacterized protein IL334_005100 [Kwoniella shivajii]|uniref:RNA polymerase I termination factor n=1 Tax=Kwoniella shivajii TaxID=564305 RepID=A0ABZ1D273_9TREE|nr:hypothetical protein IL334_005100 [Kwoniella shivajii]